MDTKRHHILNAAVEVFSRFGYRKTSMQDVADAAGMSRAALYLYFKNKDDLFRVLMERHHATATAEAEAGFAQTAPFERRLSAGLKAFVLSAMAPVQSSPYGQELFEANNTLAEDLNVATAARLQQLTQATIADAIEAGEISLGKVAVTPTLLAELIFCAIDGIKKGSDGLDQIEERIDALVRIVASATGSAG
ncbi:MULTISPECIES: TetR/AcrR family transcriptional regulator [unclassified Ensifer]|uniref:TetR/AcrR family transcriptional regulator n=1 Tax=unclassified Ensifer TaxID=2633371 RepID=UPI000A967579|nr:MULTISPECIES: TetR/AcrR family transcriptional regulator [unclassified Ensifer]